MEASRKVIVVVAHPDDETLWAGGTLLNHPAWKVYIICLCRANDKERAKKFRQALKFLNAEGTMGDLDDGPDQKPMDQNIIMHSILKLWPEQKIDMVITHSPKGEYTRHRRHEEIGEAMITLWRTGRIHLNILWAFAYEDGEGAYYPKPIPKAGVYHLLSDRTLEQKRYLMTNVYGFGINSWEVEGVTQAESFWPFKNAFDAEKWLNVQKGIK